MFEGVSEGKKTNALCEIRFSARLVVVFRLTKNKVKSNIKRNVRRVSFCILE